MDAGAAPWSAVRISAADLARIAAAAEAAYPAECCGLLVGVPAGAGAVRLTRVVATANMAASTGDRFEIDPRAQFALLRALRGGDEAVVGHYHSHPDHPAQPSATDMAQAHDPALVWMITSVARGQAVETLAYAVTGGGWRALSLVVGENDDGAENTP